MQDQDFKLCLAPMMAVTDRHFRYLLRLISPSVRLYTEMVVADALIHASPERWLSFSELEHPVACQLGGSDPKRLALAAQQVEAFGFDEVNLNVGCPSDRVQQGKMGACLMREPQLVAECVAAMKSVVSIPVTVKTRIGVDQDDDWPFFKRLIDALLAVDVDALMIHARKAWLQGVNPKQNRELPNLNYDRARKAAHYASSIPVVLNGHIAEVHQADSLAQDFAGVMIGRAIWKNPWILNAFEQAWFGQEPVSRVQVLQRYLNYAHERILQGDSARLIIRPLQTMMRGLPRAKQWRQLIQVEQNKERPDLSQLSHCAESIL